MISFSLSLRLNSSNVSHVKYMPPNAEPSHLVRERALLYNISWSPCHEHTRLLRLSPAPWFMFNAILLHVWRCKWSENSIRIQNKKNNTSNMQISVQKYKYYYSFSIKKCVRFIQIYVNTHNDAVIYVSVIYIYVCIF